MDEKIYFFDESGELSDDMKSIEKTKAIKKIIKKQELIIKKKYIEYFLLFLISSSVFSTLVSYFIYYNK